MELIPLVFVLAIPVAFTMWALTFKKLFSMLAIPPMLIIVFVVLFLNTDPTLEYTNVQSVCSAVPLNSTAIVDGNTTVTTYHARDCETISTPVSEPIQPQLMTLLNFTIIVGMLSIGFVVLRRITKLINRGQDEE